MNFSRGYDDQTVMCGGRTMARRFSGMERAQGREAAMRQGRGEAREAERESRDKKSRQGEECEERGKFALTWTPPLDPRRASLVLLQATWRRRSRS